jgi:hypothetical protein
MTDTFVPIHPRWQRLMHWMNASAMVLLIMSDRRIYDAQPIFGFCIPAAMPLGGGLGGALLWLRAAFIRTHQQRRALLSRPACSPAVPLTPTRCARHRPALVV